MIFTGFFISRTGGHRRCCLHRFVLWFRLCRWCSPHISDGITGSNHRLLYFLCNRCTTSGLLATESLALLALCTFCKTVLVWRVFSLVFPFFMPNRYASAIAPAIKYALYLFQYSLMRIVCPPSIVRWCMAACRFRVE